MSDGAKCCQKNVCSLCYALILSRDLAREVVSVGIESKACANWGKLL